MADRQAENLALGAALVSLRVAHAPSGTGRPGLVLCSCGEMSPGSWADHRTHLAAALLASDEFAEVLAGVRAEAWDNALRWIDHRVRVASADEVNAHIDTARKFNPYRADAAGGRQ